MVDYLSGSSVHISLEVLARPTLINDSIVEGFDHRRSMPLKQLTNVTIRDLWISS